MTGFANPLGRLLLARLSGSVRPAGNTASWLCSTASTNALITDRVDIGSPVSIINGEKPAHRFTHRTTKHYSISIIPIRITAPAANACRFLQTSLSKTPRTKFRGLLKTRLRGVSDQG